MRYIVAVVGQLGVYKGGAVIAENADDVQDDVQEHFFNKVGNLDVITRNEQSIADVFYYPNKLDFQGDCDKTGGCDGLYPQCRNCKEYGVHGTDRCWKNAYREKLAFFAHRGGVFLQVIDLEGDALFLSGVEVEPGVHYYGPNYTLGAGQKDEVRWAQEHGMPIWHCFSKWEAAIPNQFDQRLFMLFFNDCNEEDRERFYKVHQPDLADSNCDAEATRSTASQSSLSSIQVAEGN